MNIEILENASYIKFGSLKIVGLDGLTFRFDTDGYLYPDFWSEKDGYHKMSETEKFYLDIQNALNLALSR